MRLQVSASHLLNFTNYSLGKDFFGQINKSLQKHINMVTNKDSNNFFFPSQDGSSICNLRLRKVLKRRGLLLMDGEVGERGGGYVSGR